MPPPREQLVRILDDPLEYLMVLRFGGGLASNPNPSDIDFRECSKGKNFDLDIDNDTYRPRKVFDLKGTAPNAEKIGGFIELQKSSDDSVTVLVQAGETVYEYDGISTFTSRGTVASGSRLRGTRFSTSLLDDKVIITDLARQSVVKEWDGTTFQDFVHNLGGDLFARYAIVDNERLLLGNVKTGGTETRHVLLGSERGGISSTTLGTLSNSTRPATGVGVDAAFFLPMLDLRPINGMVRAFGGTVFSTENGTIVTLAGQDASDYAISPLYDGSAAKGDEALSYIGNDLLYGREGRIDTLIGTLAFGDVETDDISRWISDQTKEVEAWTIVYNPREHKAYLWPQNGNEVWVFHKSIYDPSRKRTTLTERPGLSPWSKWTTDFGAADFRQTAAMLVKRPTDKLDVVWWGDNQGRIFEMEGTGAQDGAANDVVVERLSGLIEAPIGHAYDVIGWVKYKKKFAATLTLTMEAGGNTLFDHEMTVTLPAFDNLPVYNNDLYYNNDVFYSTEFQGRISKQNWEAAGEPSHFRIKAAVTGAEFDISEIGIRFKAATGAKD